MNDMPKFSFKFCSPAMEDTVTDFFFMPSTLIILASTSVAVIWCRALFQCFTTINSFNCLTVLWDGNCDDAIQKGGKLRHTMQQFAHVTQLVNGRARVPQSAPTVLFYSLSAQRPPQYPEENGIFLFTVHDFCLEKRGSRCQKEHGLWSLKLWAEGQTLPPLVCLPVKGNSSNFCKPQRPHCLQSGDIIYLLWVWLILCLPHNRCVIMCNIIMSTT